MPYTKTRFRVFNKKHYAEYFILMVLLKQSLKILIPWSAPLLHAYNTSKFGKICHLKLIFDINKDLSQKFDAVTIREENPKKNNFYKKTTFFWRRVHLVNEKNCLQNLFLDISYFMT